MEEYPYLEDIMNELFGEEDLDKADIGVLFEAWDTVQDKVLIRLLNTKWNKERLEELPHKEILDLSAVFYLPMLNDEERSVSSVITYSMMKNWGISLEELWDAAIKNTKESDAYRILGVEDVVKDATGIDISRQSFTRLLYIATSTSKFFGASVLLRTDVLEELAERLKKNLFIIPSSIHELVLIPDHGIYDVDGVRNMLHEVNTKMVRTYERLSDNIYFFDWKKREVQML